MNALPTQPQSIFQVIKCGFQQGKRSFTKLFAVILVYVIFAVVNMQVRAANSHQLFFDLPLSVMLIELTVFIIILWLLAVIIYRAHLLMIGKQGAFYSVYRHAFKKYLTLLTATVIFYAIGMLINYLILHYGISSLQAVSVHTSTSDLIIDFGISLGLIVGGIIGFYFVIALFFFQYTIVIDDAGVFGSFQQSIKLVWSHWWRTAIVIACFIVVLLIPYLASIFLGDLLGYLFNLSLIYRKSLMALISIVGLTMGYPFFLNGILCLYQDLKLRREQKLKKA